MTPVATASTSVKVPLALAAVWLLSTSASTVAGPVLMATVPYWHDVRHYLQQLGLWQSWISIAVCLGLLLLSKRKHAETEEVWAKGALLIFVMGGLLSAIVTNYGVLPQWLVKPASLTLTAQLLALVLAHGCCAALALRHLWRWRQPS